MKTYKTASKRNLPLYQCSADATASKGAASVELRIDKFSDGRIIWYNVRTKQPDVLVGRITKGAEKIEAYAVDAGLGFRTIASAYFPKIELAFKHIIRNANLF